MEPTFSKSSLERFLETAGKQGFFNVNTLSGMKAAVSRILEDVGADDDVRKIDVEAATRRYHNKHPDDLSLNSLRTYEFRMKRLFDEFAKYTNDPVNYKPYNRALTKPVAERALRSDKAKSLVLERDQHFSEVVTFEPVARNGASSMTLPYPLRENFTASVTVPRNMNREEARRLCAFIRTLAADFVPEDD